MTYKTNGLLVACLSLAISSFGFAGEMHGQSETVKTSHTHVSFVKPGAAVSLESDYDGHTQPGELETVTLTLHHMYSDGHLEANLLPSSGLEVTSNFQQIQTALTKESAPTFHVQFSALKEGVYSLGLEIIYTDRMDQQSRRTVSVPITVGTAINKTADKAKTVTPKAKAPDGGVVALSGREVIR